MPAYMFVEARISDLPHFMAYAQANPAVVAQYGGRYLAIRTATEALEGDWEASKLVISVWPDMDAARRYWHSPEYARIKALRAGTGEFRVVLIDGVQQETLA
jgi:uncharacterized protein (DUF1330 family)